jgi:hypothetical protein
MNIKDVRNRLDNLLGFLIGFTLVFLVATLIGLWAYSEHLAHTIAGLTGVASATFAFSAIMLGMVLNGLPDEDPQYAAAESDRNSYLSSVQNFTAIVCKIGETLKTIAPKIVEHIALPDSDAPPSDGNPITIGRYRARQMRLDSRLTTEEVATIHSLEESAAILEQKFQVLTVSAENNSASDPAKLAAALKNMAEIAEFDPEAARKIAL